MEDRIYISGKISGLPEEESIKRFAEAETELKLRGYKVINPTRLMEYDLSYSEYMAIDLLLLQSCDTIYMLDNWETSAGASIECLMARKEGLHVMYESPHTELKKAYCSKCTNKATCEAEVEDCILDSK